jgi:outer membrane protein assembly factor BamB
MLVPMLIVLALPIAAMMAMILYHKKAALSEAPPVNGTSVVSFGTDEWPTFRGSSQLTGAADGQLPDTLKLAWTFQTEGDILSTPVIAGDTAYVSSMDNRLYAVNLQTGKEIWRFEADDDLEASPLLYDDVVYIGSSDGTFYAIDKANGKALWTFDEAGKISGGANIALLDGKPLIVFGSYDSQLYALTTAGEQALTVEADNYINGAVAVSGSTVFFGSCDANIYCVPLSNPTQFKTIDAGSYVASNPAVANGIVYAGSYEGTFLAADIATQKVLWDYDEAEDAFFSSPAISETSVYVGCRDGKLYCFDRATGDIGWTFEAADNFDSSPVICGSTIAVGNDDGRLYLIDAEAGTEIFSYTLGDAVAAGVAIAQNHLLVGCANGTIYAFTAP